MIINCSKHGRTRRDTAKLVAHLYKPENDYVVLAEIGNTAAADLKGALRDMELLRDGAIPKAAAFHHFPLSPATDRTHAEILEAAHALRREFDPGGTRPYAVVIHGKERAGGADGRVHGHFVLGNFDSEGRALKDRFTKLRTERLAREIEYSWRQDLPGAPGEPCGLGRHHASSVRALRNSRAEVAVWLVDAHGEKPEKPKSAISTASRQRAKRLDVNLPAARATVQKIWPETLEIDAFRTALSKAGYEITSGAKPGVWVLRDCKTGAVLGALDRLLKLKRQAVRNMMESIDERKQPETQPGPGAVDNRSRTKAVRSIKGDLRPIEGANAAPRIARTGYTGRGSRPDWSDHAISRNSGGPLAAADRLVARDRWKAGILACKFQHQRTLILLRGIGRRLAESKKIQEFMKEDLPPQIVEPRWDIWGIPIEPPRYRP